MQWLVLLISLSAASFTKEDPVPECKASGSKTWGPQNVFPNLFNHVFQPFLDAFTFTTMCGDSVVVPAKCNYIPVTGTFEERCALIAVDGPLQYWAVLIKYLLGVSLARTETLVETLDVMSSCHTIVRRGDAAFDEKRQCLRSTLAFQCLWNNAHWILLPAGAIFFLGIVPVVLAMITACCCTLAE